MFYKTLSNTLTVGIVMKNTLYTGDNLFILNGMNSQSVDLIYLDPPFNSKRMYSAPIGSKAAGISFKDMWTWDDVDVAYLKGLVDNYPSLVRFIMSIGEVHSKGMMAYITYMTQRVIALHRILKDTGSLYLHVDPTASHYLKIVLDRVFGKQNFRSEITWKRQAAKKGSQYKKKSFGASSDIILYYSKTKNYQFSIPRVHLDKNVLEKKFNRIGKDGRRFRTDRITLPRVMRRENLIYEYKGYIPEDGWMMVKEKIVQMDKENRIYWTNENKPYRKYFADEYEGLEVSNVWTDIAVATGREATGYPTQKPLALLERIIRASSKEGDVVLDPFCGCATTCVKAQHLGRKWIGIDIEKQAAHVLIDRLSEESGLFKDFVHSDKIPVRTDVEKIEPTKKQVKERLYKEQKGNCNGCDGKQEIYNLEVDHIIPKSKGGGDYYENYQLLCSSCNKIKGNRPMEYLMNYISKREDLLKNKISFID